MKVKSVDKRYKCKDEMKWVLSFASYHEFREVYRVCQNTFGQGEYLDFYTGVRRIRPRWGYYHKREQITLRDDKDLTWLQLLL